MIDYMASAGPHISVKVDEVFNVAGVIVSRSGNTPPDVPERLANLWLSWQRLPQWTRSGGARHVVTSWC